MTVNAGGCLDPACVDLGKIGRCMEEAKIFLMISLGFSPEMLHFSSCFQWKACCAQHRELTALPRDLQTIGREKWRIMKLQLLQHGVVSVSAH